MRVRVYLAWQVIRDGRPQVRRWSPDKPGEFFGYEKRTARVIAWLMHRGDPRWPDCLSGPHGEPLEVIDTETGEVTSGTDS